MLGSCLFLLSAVAARSADADENWQTLITKYTIICFHSEADMSKFDDDIDYSPGSGFTALFGGSGGGDSTTKLVRKIDSLFLRAQDILAMRKYIRKVRIQIYANNDQLQNAYHQEIKSTDSSDNRAWYDFNQHTIYVQVKDLNEGMLAHEMAHAIIDNYFQVRPPSATAEILARYVDAHLND